jgi:ABC-type polysaccharide/polyol phosphate transport system ATPase subunit
MFYKKERVASMQSVISIKNISKTYKLYEKKSDILKELINPLSNSLHKEFHALKDINLEIKANEVLGIIGKNGSGKSTLLKLITGVLTPSAGEINVSGTISAILELGAGFNPEYTGLENIYLNGTIMGLSKVQVDNRLESILSFADIGEFINQPVKTYSSGMYVRLAFSVAINVEPDILIVDEALSVGDIRFQQKCLRKIEELKATKTIIFVSHDMAAISNYCDRVIWLNNGKIVGDDTAVEIAKKYQAFMMGNEIFKKKHEVHSTKAVLQLGTLDKLANDVDVMGDRKVEIVGLSMLDADTNQKTNIFEPKQKVKIMINARANEDIEKLIVGLSIKDKLGNIVCESNSLVLKNNPRALKNDEVTTYCFQFELPELNKGTYTITPAIASGTLEEHFQHYLVHDALIFHITNHEKHSLQGLLVLNQIEFIEF